uniref:Cytochrome c oxidase subunit 5A, mitochondrial n=2 Tax=Gouania willdenowi TaxID=441366 RepID=A0A8C5E3W4_GOUWI
MAATRQKTTNRRRSWCSRCQSSPTDKHQSTGRCCCCTGIMFRTAVRLSVSGVRSLTCTHPGSRAVFASRCYSHGKQETDEEFDARWVTYFNKPDIDAWELRKGMNTLIGYDLVPEPKILEAALKACRRLDDLASAIRILEAVKEKAGPHKDIYPYLVQELRPTLDELGISTPEELGIDKA